MMMVTTTAVADYNLTGLWHADDGGLYYIRHVGDQIWWAGLSTNSTAGYLDFFKGLDFANVFRGTLSGTRISGTWADVPRGAILSHGTLALDILPDYPSGLALRKVSATGGFGANVWHNYVIATPATECSARPGVRCAFDHVHKNDGSTLYDNLKPEKDYVAIFGWVAEGLGLSYPATAGRTYDDFIAVGDHDDGDGDLVFNLYVDWANLNAQPGFWTTNWEYPDGPSVVMSKLRANQYKLHGETIMYGRSDGHHPPLLPGWMESNANSPLWNGRPINGLVLARPPTSVDGAVLTRGKRIRVTGVLALDCGHFPYDCENDDMAEIHPVYSIDVVQDWTQRGPTANLTGVWAGGDGGTYYIRQIGNTVWWLGLSVDEGRTCWGSAASSWRPLLAAHRGVRQQTSTQQGVRLKQVVSPQRSRRANVSCSAGTASGP